MLLIVLTVHVLSRPLSSVGELCSKIFNG